MGKCHHGPLLLVQREGAVDLLTSYVRLHLVRRIPGMVSPGGTEHVEVANTNGRRVSIHASDFLSDLNAAPFEHDTQPGHPPVLAPLHTACRYHVVPWRKVVVCLRASQRQ